MRKTFRSFAFLPSSEVCSDIGPSKALHVKLLFVIVERGITNVNNMQLHLAYFVLQNCKLALIDFHISHPNGDAI